MKASLRRIFATLVIVALPLVLAMHAAQSITDSAQPCLIVKPNSTAHRAFVSNTAYQYVAGDFPTGLKFKSNIGDGYVRKIKEKGGKIIVLPAKYSIADLEQAKASCKEPDKK